MKTGEFFKKKSFIIVVLVAVIALICFTAYGSMRKKDNRVKASGTVEVTEIRSLRKQEGEYWNLTCARRTQFKRET